MAMSVESMRDDIAKMLEIVGLDKLDISIKMGESYLVFRYTPGGYEPEQLSQEEYSRMENKGSLVDIPSMTELSPTNRMQLIRILGIEKEFEARKLQYLHEHSPKKMEDRHPIGTAKTTRKKTIEQSHDEAPQERVERIRKSLTHDFHNPIGNLKGAK